MSAADIPATSISFLGLGAMGQAMVTSFLETGYSITVWNRTASKADDLISKGAVRADTVAEAVAASPLVITCLWDYAVVRDVLAPAADALSGRVLVNLTNGSPDQARAMAAWAGEHGASYLDGGIMAVPPMIGQPSALILYSGDAAAFEKYRATLETLGTARYLGSDPGFAPLYDLAMLIGMYGMLMGAVQSLTMIRAAGDDPREFSASFLIPWLNAMSGSIPQYAENIQSGKHTVDVVSNLAMQAAAFPNAVQACASLGVRLDFLLPLKALMEQAVADGHRDADLSVLAELLTS